MDFSQPLSLTSSSKLLHCLSFNILLLHFGLFISFIFKLFQRMQILKIHGMVGFLALYNIMNSFGVCAGRLKLFSKTHSDTSLFCFVCVKRNLGMTWVKNLSNLSLYLSSSQSLGSNVMLQNRAFLYVQQVCGKQLSLN